MKAALTLAAGIALALVGSTLGASSAAGSPAKAPSEAGLSVHLRALVPLGGVHVPTGIQIGGAELGLEWDGYAIDLGGAASTFILSYGWRAYMQAGRYWTVVDRRDADGVGTVLRLPTLVGLEYLHSDWMCGDGYCQDTIYGVTGGVSFGFDFICWTGIGAGFDLRLLGTLALPLGGDIDTPYPVDKQSWSEASSLFGLAATLALGVSL